MPRSEPEGEKLRQVPETPNDIPETPIDNRVRSTTTGRRLVHAVAPVTLVLALLLTSCSSSSKSSTSASTTPPTTVVKLTGTLNGSGSSFQTVYQQSAIAAFRSVQPNMTVNYGSGGSGKGRTDLASGVVNFAGSDSPIPAADQSKFTGTVLYFPDVIGPITISYHLSGVSSLKLDGPTIAKIFQAQITTWNNPAIAALNPGVTLPSTKITVARRSDSSGTTQNFSQFLVSSAPGVWTLGTSSTISWPASTVGGNGNGGVASLVKSTDGAIGYVDFADASASGLTYASVKNMAGNFVAPSVQSATEAASNATIAPNLTFSAIWAAGAGSYPITYQSWVLVYQSQSATNAQLLQSWIGYLIGGGQSLLSGLNYAPLPSNLQNMAKAQLSKIGT
jgi:phosphate transport system substrate-binding protein